MLFARAYTLAEADALVPLLVERLSRIQGMFIDARALEDAIEGTAAAPPAAATDAGVALAHSTDAHAALSRLERALGAQLLELGRMGVHVKALDPPIANVYARLKGHGLVSLAWRLGDAQFLYWHDVDESFADRRLIDDESAFGDDVRQ